MGKTFWAFVLLLRPSLSFSFGGEGAAPFAALTPRKEGKGKGKRRLRLGQCKDLRPIDTKIEWRDDACLRTQYKRIY